MLEFASPTYMLELRNSLNRSCILSAKPVKKFKFLCGLHTTPRRDL
ncbi:MAG: hypothetical protein EWM73_02918 [Nitrospira sp.]|nr:MAG: hypothetical protein EWM73_02918 [Nitrospira sp.]